MSQDGQAKINQINDTLGRYTTVLAKCIDSKTKNHALTKQKLETIATLIKKIEEKINTTQNNVKVLDESRKEWEVNLRQQTETENVKLKEQIEEERKKENELKEKIRADREKNSKLMDTVNKEQEQLQAKLDELTKGKEEDNEKHRKELENINAEKLKADEQHQKDIETANAEREQAKENIRKNEEILKNEIQTAKQERAKKDQEYQAQLAKLGEDKDAAANLLKERISELNQEVKKLADEKVLELEKYTTEKKTLTEEYGQKEGTHIAEKKRLQDELEAAKKSHLEEVQRLKDEHMREMGEIRKDHDKVSAIQKEVQTKKNAETEELNKALESCETTKKGYEEVMNNNQAKMEELMKKYKDNENIVLDEIIALLKSVGDIEVKQLQSLTSSTSSPAQLKRSGSLTDSLGSEGKDMMEKLRRKQREQQQGKRKQAWVDDKKSEHHKIFFKGKGVLHRNVIIEDKLKAPIDKYVDKHTPEELHLKILENRGFVNDSLKRPIKTSMEAVDWKKHDINGAFKRILKNIIKTHSILIGGVVKAFEKGKDLENIFEDLLTAFYIIHSSRQIHSFLIDNKNYDDTVLEEGGKHAGHLWAGGEGYLGEFKREIDKDEHSQYRIYIQNNDSTMNDLFAKRPSGLAVKAHTSWKTMRQFGGFRHGKGSQKKNKRTLKSKLTAKKYSLKVGKKKRGKKGNKSQKRRKSIKIRI